MVSSCGINTLNIFGVIGVISGVVLLASFQSMYDAILEKQLILENGSYAYELWTEIPDDLAMISRVYLYNISNYEEIENRVGNDYPKPILQEVGPFTYKEKHFKDEVVFNENGTVTYKTRKQWIFLEDESPSLDSMIVNFNIISMAASEYARNMQSPFVAYSIDELMKQQDVHTFMKYPARNWTFEGIFDGMMEAVTDPDVAVMFPVTVPWDKFGWFYPRNDSSEYDGVFHMWTGASDIQQIGKISEWNYMDHINESIYPGTCGELRGTAGEFFPPGQGKDYLEFFSGDLCRSIRFDYAEEVRVDGARGYKYKMGQSLVDGSLPENSCYNPQPMPDLELPLGLLNVTACKFDSPSFVSYPHFYLADPKLSQAFEAHPDTDLSADPAKHESFLSLDPNSGIPLEVAVRMQINGLLRPCNISAGNGNYVSVTAFDGLNDTFVPLIWFETSTRINGSTEMGFMVILVSNLHLIMYGLGGFILTCGAIFLLIGTYFYIKQRNTLTHQKFQNKNNEDDKIIRRI